jgi:hypothetical protein
MSCWLILLATSVAAHRAVLAPAFELVKRGRPVAEIVLGPSADAGDRRAADILTRSIERMSGATLPVATVADPQRPSVELGVPQQDLPAELNRPALKPDGFAVGVSGRNLYIRSGGGKGAVYAVVQLLEKYLGCRYYSPAVQVFPRKKDISLRPFTDIDNPRNEYRCINGDFDSDPGWQDWQRLNTTDEMFGRGYYVHTFHRLVPPETYFAQHPEYFAMIDGRRTQEQLCPSRPENIEIAVQQLKKEMALQPDKKVWSVSQNDNETYCHCPECMKIIQEEGSPAGPILRFVNEIAKRFPDKTISTLAYEFSRSAPKLTKPEQNVQIMLCTIELNRGLPIESDPTSADFRRDIEDWGRIAHNIYLWDYTVDFSHQVSPFPNLHVLQPNIRFFSRNGVRQHFQQTNTSYGHEFSELKSYLEARLLWNPDADAKAIVKDFLSGYYGPAGPLVGRYIQALEAAQLRGGKRLDIFERPNNHANDYLSAGNLAKYNALFDEAERTVASQPEYLERVRTARLPIQYATIALASDDVFGPRGFFADRNGKPELKPEMTRTLEEFYGTCTRNHVRSVNESNLTPKQFYDAAVRLTQLQMNSVAFRKPVTSDPPPSPKYGHGDLSLLTNGVLGGSDFGVQWLGWEGLDFTLNLDLGRPTRCGEASIDTISAWRSWILHPLSVTCEVSTDGSYFQEVGRQTAAPEPETTEPIKTFKFNWIPGEIRFIRFKVEGTKTLPAWHPGAGGKSWVFVDEVLVH